MRRAAVVLACALLLGACGGDDEEAAAPARDANGTDLAFARTMMVHHEGAIEMAGLARRATSRPQIRRFAAGIVRDQRRETGALRHYVEELEALGVEMGHMGMSAHEMGMGHDLEALRAARPFDRAFLDAMVPHHEGAIRMAERELADGDHAGLRRLATMIATAQRREIGRMLAWRASWFGDAAAAHGDGGH